MDDKTKRIQTLNDLARTSFLGCRVMITPGVNALDDLSAVLTTVRTFDAFTEDNDPYGEHDFGSFRHGEETLFWKINYYDRTLTARSEDPADPNVTTRVLTISRPRKWAPPQASIATTHVGSWLKNSKTCPRRSFLRKTARPAP